MKHLILEDLTEFEKMSSFNSGARRENLKACHIDKLLRYYEICIDAGFHRARLAIEEDLRRRDLSELIAPVHLLFKPSTTPLTLGLAQMVIDCKGDGSKILEKTRGSFVGTEMLCAAYLMAIAFGENELEASIRSIIKTLGTFTKYMKNFIELSSANPKIVARLAELRKDMEDYKAW